MRSFRITSAVLGPERYIDLHVYQTRGWMRRVVHGLTGDPEDLQLDGAAHLYVNTDDPTDAIAAVYLCRPALTLETIAHELHHATLGVYGAWVAPDTPDVLTCGNEPLAHMFSEALIATLETLAQEGYEIDGYRPWWVAA